jgi:hypothetical protein
VKSAEGIDAASSGSVQRAERPAEAVRTRATSAGVMNPPLLPKLLRTNEPTAAIHSSFWLPIGIIMSV